MNTVQLGLCPCPAPNSDWQTCTSAVPASQLRVPRSCQQSQVKPDINQLAVAVSLPSKRTHARLYPKRGAAWAAHPRVAAGGRFGAPALGAALYSPESGYNDGGDPLAAEDGPCEARVAQGGMGRRRLWALVAVVLAASCCGAQVCAVG